MEGAEQVMKRMRYLASTAALVFVTASMLAAGGANAATSAPARASVAVVTPDCSPCFPHTKNGHAPLFRHDGSFWGTLPLNDEVEVTCWYLGSNPGWSSDGYQDHVAWVNSVGAFNGHIPDYYINFGGLTPDAEGLPHC
jgi:hypothetical protein